MILLYIETPNYFLILGLAIIVLLIGCLLIRWAVRADSVVKNQQTTIWFLILLCKKQGATDDEIQALKDHFHIS